MSNIMKFSQPVRVGNFGSAPSDTSAGAIYWDTGSSSLWVGNGASYSELALATNEFLTSVFRLDDSSDPTKKISFDASGIATSTTRSLKMPNADVDLGNLTNSNISSSAAISYSKLAALTANRLLLSDGSGFVSVSSVTSTEAGYLSGVTSAIQTQLNAKLTSTLSDGNIFVGNGSNVATSVNPSGDIDVSNTGVFSINSGVIVNADINASAAIDATKIANGSVSNTEFQYLDGVTSAIQTQLDAKQETSEKGQANGYASLDGAGKVPVSQLPNSVMEFQGAWDALTNTPTLADGTGNAGDVYRVSVAGTQDLGSGSIQFFIGDFVIYSGSVWQRSPMADGVQSVNGQSGIVVLDSDDISEGSTNLYFTDERAQDAVGGILANSSKVSLTYSDATPSITANIVAGSLVNADINASAAIAYSKLNLSGSILNADINASAAIAYSKLNLSGSIVNADINSSAAIAYSKLNLALSIVNGDISTSAAIAYSKLALSNSIVNADINSSAAIAYSKLNLSASIVNADIASGAAIALNKLAGLTVSRALQSDGSGVISVSSVTSTELGYVSGVTSAIQTQLNTKLSSVSQDSAPTLGGDLTVNGHSLIGVVRRGASPSTSVEEDYQDALSLTASTTAVLAGLTFDSRNYKSCKIDYQVANGNDRRSGTLMVVCNNASGADATAVSITDQSTETADINLSWSAAINSHNIELSYTTSSGTYVMRADIKRFRA